MRGLALAVACAAVLASAPAARAHALDEYVQALRVGVSAQGHTLSLSLTPGVRIAGEVLRRIDLNDDGVLSPDEAERYARDVIADLSVSVDGAEVPVSLLRVELPPIGEMRDGQGVIRVELSAPGPITRGRHQVVVRNDHFPGPSVYLANALQPDDPGRRIISQRRDTRQQTFWLEYEAAATSAPRWTATLLASASLLMLAWSRRRGRWGQRG
jgi:hypothetical protein